jgi:hypothetical protein
VASDLHSRDEGRTLAALYTSVTRLILTVALPIVAVQLVSSRELLSVFGPAYVSGYVPLVIYLGGVVAGSAVGGVGVHLGVGAYLGVVVGLGVEPADRLVVRTLASKYRRGVTALLG